MEKEVKLIMSSDRAISITINESKKVDILESKRDISAQQIYELLDYKLGDHFSVTSLNEKNLDAQVLKFFQDLFESICIRLNEIIIPPKDGSGE